MIKVRNAIAIGLFATAASFAQLLSYPERVLKYDSDPTLDAALKAHWADWKTQFGTSGTIVATDPNGKVAQISEAQSYGMLLAVWFNDEAFFQKVWTDTKSKFWGGDHFAWKIGSGADPNFAGDADQDILGALIFASALKDSGYWKGSTDYKGDAKMILGKMSGHLINSNNTIAAWSNAGNDNLCPAYFMPGWYPVFAEFQSANAVSGPNWSAVRTAVYGVYNKQVNASKGMARNWSNSSGGAISPGTGSKPTEADMGFDAIRVPWRIALDNIWYHNPAAGKWCESVWTAGVVKAGTAGMYTVDGPTLWGWTTNEYEKPMTMAMWGACAASVKDSSAACASAASALKGYVSTKLKAFPYFTTFDETPRTNYYAQTLALFGALTIAGRAWNVWDDMKNKWIPPDTALKVTKALSATPSAVGAGVTTHISAVLSHTADWKLTLTGKNSTANYWITGSGTAVDLDWNSSLKKVGAVFTNETVDVVLSGIGTGTPAGSTTTITISGVSVQPRTERLKGMSWTASGLSLPEGIVHAGTSYRVRVLDLQGRQVGDSWSGTASSDNLLNAPVPARGMGLQILELHGADGQTIQSLLPYAR